MTLEEMVGLAEDHARRILVGTKEELLPQWLIVGADDKIEIWATPWSSASEKRLVVEAMRSTLRQGHAKAYSLLVEAWYSVLPASEAPTEYTGPPPSERPDRQEAVVVTAANREGEVVYRQWEIVRSSKGGGKCIDLRRLDGPEDRMTSALFDNLLDERKPS
jgi:hypothetical protein